MSPDAAALTTLLDSLSEGICLVGRDGSVAALNKEFLALLDLPPDFLRAGDPVAKLPAFLRQRGADGPLPLSEAVLQMMARAPSQPLVQEHLGGDGRALEFRCRPGPSGGFVLVVKDISEQHRSALALRQSEERAQDLLETQQRMKGAEDLLKRALDSIADGFAIFDPGDRLA